jgi:hypothetical protein
MAAPFPHSWEQTQQLILAKIQIGNMGRILSVFAEVTDDDHHDKTNKGI